MKNLGIDTFQFLAQLVNVTILLVVLKKFLYKPILSVIEKRQQAIDEGLNLRNEMESELKKLEEKEKELEIKSKTKMREAEAIGLRETRNQAKRILEEAKKAADKIRRQAKDDANRELLASRAKMRAEITAEAAELANQALTKLLPKNVRIKLTEAQVGRLNAEK